MELIINGVEELQRVLTNLSPALKDKILIKALQKISKPIINDAQTLIWSHQRTGRLFRSIGEKIDKKNNRIILGARRGGKFKGFHAHLLEEGTEQRQYKTKKGTVKKTGKIIGVHYWQTAIDKNQNKTQDLGQYIFESLENEIDRIYKKSLK